MSVSKAKTWGIAALVAASLIAGGVALRVWVFPDEQIGAAADSGPVPVEAAAVEQGPIERRREFTGTLEAAAEFTVAPKVGGRIEQINVDLGDLVTRGQVVAVLDDEELRQAEAEARADLVVARARASAAEKVAALARRTFGRIEGLRGRDISSEQELDTARAAKVEAEAALEVAEAEVVRAQAVFKAAQIRRGYTEVTVQWSEAEGREADERRLVAARFADEGGLLAANAPLLTIVDLDPVIVVVFVTEVDYAELAPGIPVTLRADAYPGETFAGEISRIAPVFREQTRQARVEMRVPNSDGRLKPGMFVRAGAVLERVPQATIVPASALVERNDEVVIFVLGEAGETVALRAVEVGVREGERVAVKAIDGAPITGRVITLGQQQLVDGSAVVVPERRMSEGGPS
ncbi:efflux RND transporter periplasmic adaptor subunit [Enhygromyxa salina]|uniref:Macrolide export protein MacA n=1 Tax=Enhygromyxa salina TaxID=215803 RepID=A0A2S9YSW7_9BACT|nr:efflux RND transporter periplasmic adaptor subunit [Enhygromyxa salina]PRQ08197.1 Macrolide export protein MacA [Enhygromyxa salina]